MKRNKKMSIKSLLVVSLLSLALGFGGGFYYKEKSIENPKKNKISQLENTKNDSIKEPEKNTISQLENTKNDSIKKPKKNTISQLEEIIKEKIPSYYKKECQQFLKAPNALELARELEDNYSTYYLEDYTFLLNQNINPKIIAKIPNYKLDDFIKLFKWNRIPKELIDHLADSRNYSIEVAGKNPVFGTDTDKIREYIIGKLDKKKHCFRKWTDYEESSSQVYSIENINILYLIKGYIDYFDKPENVKIIFDMMEKDLANLYSEEGGLVVYSDDGYKFIRYNERDFETKNLENNDSYPIPDWFEYIGHIGMFHFHATQDDNTKYSGPSGYAKKDKEYFNGDLGVLRVCIKDNPYEVRCVITKLKGDKFNVDLYFHDIKEFILKFSASEATVLDLGIYNKPK